MNMNTIVLVSVIIANGATIITVFASAMKLSSQFGKMQEAVKHNSDRIEKNENKIHAIEGAL